MTLDNQLSFYLLPRADFSGMRLFGFFTVSYLRGWPPQLRMENEIPAPQPEEAEKHPDLGVLGVTPAAARAWTPCAYGTAQGSSPVCG